MQANTTRPEGAILPVVDINDDGDFAAPDDRLTIPIRRAAAWRIVEAATKLDENQDVTGGVGGDWEAFEVLVDGVENAIDEYRQFSHATWSVFAGSPVAAVVQEAADDAWHTIAGCAEERGDDAEAVAEAARTQADLERLAAQLEAWALRASR